MQTLARLAIAATMLLPASAHAALPYACGGAAIAGGAKLLCSHTDPRATAQSCSFFWSLKSTEDVTSTVTGAFLLTPGTSNVLVYQGFGFSEALADPIIVCTGQGRPS